jgi:hypothetical protein
MNLELGRKCGTPSGEGGSSRSGSRESSPGHTSSPRVQPEDPRCCRLTATDDTKSHVQYFRYLFLWYLLHEMTVLIVVALVTSH